MKAVVLLALCALLFAPDPGSAGWGPSGCGPVGPRVALSKLPVEPARPTYTWRSTDDEHFQLYQHGRHVADYTWSTDMFQFVGRSPSVPPWGARSKIPEKKVEEPVNFGVDWTRLNHEDEACSINGKPATKAQCVAAIEGPAGQLRDDSLLPRLTVIGAKVERERVLQDLATHPALAPFRDHYVVTSYEPSDWQVARYGFVCSGKPTICLQPSANDSRVLHRQDSYESGPEGLATALRKAFPQYDPKKDPDKTKQVLPPLADIPLWAWVAFGGLGLVFLLPGPLPE